PLTILVGENGSGKSNILEAIALLAQSVGLNGFQYQGGKYLNLISYASPEDFAHKRILGSWTTMEIHVTTEDSEKERLSSIAEAVNIASLGVSIGQVSSLGYRYSGIISEAYPGQTRQSVLCDDKELITAGHVQVDKSGWRNGFEYPPILRPATCGETSYVLTPSVFSQSRETVEEAKPLTDFGQAAIEIIACKLRPQRGRKSKVFLISALRGDVESEAATKGEPEWVGKHGENLLQILSLISPIEHKKKLEKIQEWAFRFGLKEPWGRWKGKDQLGVEYEDPKLSAVFKLALASYGCKQVMSIITQLFWSEPGDIIMIEEPEISLHPNSQANLPELFGEAICEGKQVLLTTHSLVLPLALGRPIEKGLLKPSDIAVWHIKKEPRGTIAENLELTERGYIKGWIPSFAEIELELMQEWARTLPGA
ncbi:MAG: hypothetical protein DRI01_09840, partial [Chloroflexi bacterium]